MHTPSRAMLALSGQAMCAATLRGEAWTPAEEAICHAAYAVLEEAASAMGVPAADTMRAASQQALDIAMDPAYPGA